MTLLMTEMRRALSRRVTKVLIGLALAGCVVISVVTLVTSQEFTPERRARAEVQRQADEAACEQESLRTGGGPGDCGRTLADYDRSIHLVELWPSGGADPILATAVILLVVGALVGGATVVGGEWRHHTVATLLLWESRRTRVVVARLAAVAILAAVVALALEVVYSAALLPAAVIKGDTTGVDGAWLAGLAGAMARGAGLAALAAAVGGSLAMVGRATAAAVGGAFVYLAVFEPLVAGLRPGLQSWLVVQNLAVVLLGQVPEGLPIHRSVLGAAAVVAAYAAALAGLAVASLRWRDVPTA